jgi:hypothetical protein
MIIGLIAVIVGALATGSGMFSSAMNSDRVAAELRSQADMIRTKIEECTFITRMNPPRPWVALSFFNPNETVVNAGNMYQTIAGGTAGTTAPTHTSGSGSDGSVTWAYVGPFNSLMYPKDDDLDVEVAVRDMECPRDPAGRRNLWSGERPANLPQTPTGFEDWVYINHGDPTVVSPGGTCIAIQPQASAVNDAGLRSGIALALSRFATTEYTYDPNDPDQRIIFWLRRPASGTVCEEP